MIISLIPGSVVLSADENLPTAGEILQNGKIIHKEIHLKRDAKLFPEDMDLQEYETAIGMIVYHVIYAEEYYDCVTRASGLHFPTNIICAKFTQEPTINYKKRD